MPGPELAYQIGPDLYPKTPDDHAQLLAWCNQAFTAAENAKKSRTERWRKYHRIARSYIERDEAASWRSAMFVPYSFSIIESITPRMVAQLPRMICLPVGPEDVWPAKFMEQLLVESSEKTDLYVELIKAIKSSLKYGTGLLKNYYHQDIRVAWERVPQMEMVEVPGAEEPVLDDQGRPQGDVDGNPLVQAGAPTQTQQPVLDENGQPVMTWKPYEYVYYEGPCSTWVDPFHFFIAPEATTIDEARYVIERFYRDVPHVEKMIAQGVYQLPPGMTVEEMSAENEEGIHIREDEVGEGHGGSTSDTTRRPVELREYHTKDGRVITVANGSVILRVRANPYNHGEKPYTAFPDYMQEGEFWGVGEIEAIEGLQDMLNALYNQRIDNVRLTMDAMFAVNAKALEDERDLLLRPGGIIRVAGDFLPEEAVKRLDLGDVTGSAFAEADQIERLIERVSGISGYQLGTTDEGMNKTATGISLMTEAGASKFALKVRLMELVGMRRLARQWGSHVQQFTDEERTIRVLGPAGQFLFPTLTPESVQGALDYRIDVASSTQTEQTRKEQALMLAQTIAPIWPQAIPKLVQDLLEEFGKKDLTPYMMGSPDLMLMVQAMQAQEQGGMILPFPQQQDSEQGEEPAGAGGGQGGY